jgi:hypothetical protein
MLRELVTKTSSYKSLRSNEEINVTNGTFISSSIKTDIILQLMTMNNKEKQKEINQIGEI